MSKAGITAFCENATEALNNSQQGYQRITRSSYPRTIRNHRLTKFDWSAEELDLGPLTNYREYVACTIDQMTEHDELSPCDVYTIRKKTPLSQPESYFDPLKKDVIVKLSLLFAAVPTMMKTKPNIIRAKKIKCLITLFLNSWEEMAEFEKTEDLKRQQQRLVKPSTFPKKKKSQLSKIKNFFKKKNSNH